MQITYNIGYSETSCDYTIVPGRKIPVCKNISPDGVSQQRMSHLQNPVHDCTQSTEYLHVGYQQAYQQWRQESLGLIENALSRFSFFCNKHEVQYVDKHQYKVWVEKIWGRRSLACPLKNALKNKISFWVLANARKIYNSSLVQARTSNPRLPWKTIN